MRLDSGDFIALSRQVRGILDEGGLQDAKIMVSGDLDEYRIRGIVQAGAPVDSFGVGTQLATSADAPAMSATYKLAELDIQGIKRFTAKYSEDKISVPGAKQVFRAEERDVIARSGECGNGEALLRPVILGANWWSRFRWWSRRGSGRHSRSPASRRRSGNSERPSREMSSTAVNCGN